MKVLEWIRVIITAVILIITFPLWIIGVIIVANSMNDLDECYEDADHYYV